jgi:ethanolamine ammonia-lyase large subunit
MLGYLTTAYQDHVRIRDKFGFKVNDPMWSFFQRLDGVIDSNGKPTKHFGDPRKTAVAAMRLRHSDKYNVQIVISDGLCALALMDMNHLSPYLASLRNELTNQGYKPSPDNALVRGGRVRAGYQLGELLYGGRASATATATIIHLIGERPGSGHHTFSAYLTAPAISVWSQPGKVDHNITRVISGIADTAYDPRGAGIETVKILMSIAPP